MQDTKRLDNLEEFLTYQAVNPMKIHTLVWDNASSDHDKYHDMYHMDTVSGYLCGLFPHLSKTALTYSQ